MINSIADGSSRNNDAHLELELITVQDSLHTPRLDNNKNKNRNNKNSNNISNNKKS